MSQLKSQKVKSQKRKSPKRRSQAGRPKAGSVLAVRMLVARTRWLEGHLFWRAGEVIWTTEEGDTLPDARELSRTQKCLNKISGFPNAAPLALGDSHAWLTQQRQRLALAKRLRELSGTDVMLLAQEARRLNPAVAGELSHLLIAEALCLNPLPAAPSESLVILGVPGILPIQYLLQDNDLPPSVRSLAALTLGAISNTHSLARLPTEFSANAQISGAYRWGQEQGLPSEPALVAALIASNKELAGRCLKAIQPGSTFGLPTEVLRGMLAEGLAPATVVELAEVAQAAKSVAERLRQVRQELPDLQYRQKRQAVSEARRTERQQVIESLAELLVAYAHSTKNPIVLRQVTVFLHKMLNLSDPLTSRFEATTAVLDQALEVTQMGLKLPPTQQLSYWELLVERHESFWDMAALPTSDKLHREINRIQGWLHEVQSRHVSPLRKLLAITQDKAVVAAAFDRGIAQELASQEWTEPDLYRLLVTLAGSFDLKKDHFFLREISRVLETCSDAREARHYFQTLLAPLQTVPIHARIHVLETMFSVTGYTRQAIHGQVPRLIPFLTSLARFTEKDEGEWCSCGPVIEATLALVQAAPEQAKAQIDWLLSFLTSLPQKKDWTYQQYVSLRTGLMLATSLAADNTQQFQRAVQTAMQHHFQQDQDQIKEGLQFVDRFPTLRGPLAHLFPQQPQRITNIIVRLGLTTRLRTDVHPLLTKLTPQAASDFSVGTCFPVFLRPDSAWWNLHRQTPDLTRVANAYLHAQWLTGQPQNVPPGVRRALDRPQRTARELAHLEGLLAASPDRKDLAARAAKLRDLLSDEPRLTTEISDEVRERLPQAAAEAQVAAIERQVLVCYRTRLEAVAGLLPPDLILTDDLINATLLSVDITENRKLLRRLIRAYLSGENNCGENNCGENDWRERHPANRAFLESLAERGVDTGVWLSEFPRRFRCEDVPGKWVHLRLERDPLHILQMGNHFGTCLSFGGVNAFSTVANACELNKRVIYARDHTGHVVGRKLIGISDAGELVGFHTYCSLTVDKSYDILPAIFHSYATSFARRCSLRLAETGTVPTLFAEAWYDDGIVAWNFEEQPLTASGQVKPHLKSLPPS